MIYFQSLINLKLFFSFTLSQLDRVARKNLPSYCYNYRGWKYFYISVAKEGAALPSLQWSVLLHQCILGPSDSPSDGRNAFHNIRVNSAGLQSVLARFRTGPFDVSFGSGYPPASHWVRNMEGICEHDLRISLLWSLLIHNRSEHACFQANLHYFLTHTVKLSLR